MRVLAACAIVLLASVGSAAAQSPGPYVTGHVGATGGDGGGALITGAAAGYMSPRRLAFELEVSVSPDVEFPAPPFAILSIFPAPTFDVEGRMVWLQTNVVATLVDAGKLRAAVIGGGGVVNVRREITYNFPVPTLIVTSTVLPLPPRFPDSTRVTSTETAMSLHAGGVVDYEMTKHLRVGVDARYMHAFLNEPMKAARVTARVQWQF
jgi:Outer membrane protein beta-barrel domain